MFHPTVRCLTTIFNLIGVSKAQERVNWKPFGDDELISAYQSPSLLYLALTLGKYELVLYLVDIGAKIDFAKHLHLFERKHTWASTPYNVRFGSRFLLSCIENHSNDLILRWFVKNYPVEAEKMILNNNIPLKYAIRKCKPILANFFIQYNNSHQKNEKGPKDKKDIGNKHHSSIVEEFGKDIHTWFPCLQRILLFSPRIVQINMFQWLFTLFCPYICDFSRDKNRSFIEWAIIFNNFQCGNIVLKFSHQLYQDGKKFETGSNQEQNYLSETESCNNTKILYYNPISSTCSSPGSDIYNLVLFSPMSDYTNDYNPAYKIQTSQSLSPIMFLSCGGGIVTEHKDDLTSFFGLDFSQIDNTHPYSVPNYDFPVAVVYGDDDLEAIEGFRRFGMLGEANSAQIIEGICEDFVQFLIQNNDFERETIKNINIPQEDFKRRRNDLVSWAFFEKTILLRWLSMFVVLVFLFIFKPF
jgi:hypothetical protein